jgi:hypothetical protein
MVSLEAKNRSAATITAYRADLVQFFGWIEENNTAVRRPAQIERADVTEYLADLGRKQITGLSRARKLAALREFFRYLVGLDVLTKSPADGVETPNRLLKNWGFWSSRRFGLSYVARSPSFSCAGVVDWRPAGMRSGTCPALRTRSGQAPPYAAAGKTSAFTRSRLIRTRLYAAPTK